MACRRHHRTDNTDARHRRASPHAGISSLWPVVAQTLQVISAVQARVLLGDMRNLLCSAFVGRGLFRWLVRARPGAVIGHESSVRRSELGVRTPTAVRVRPRPQPAAPPSSPGKGGSRSIVRAGRSCGGQATLPRQGSGALYLRRDPRPWPPRACSAPPWPPVDSERTIGPSPLPDRSRAHPARIQSVPPESRADVSHRIPPVEPVGASPVVSCANCVICAK